MGSLNEDMIFGWMKTWLQ